ncbi:MAG TPA: ABC transporter permease [Bacillales bacterium]|nr:ABC transporter permease [Bacillales bacterium]
MNAMFKIMKEQFQNLYLIRRLSLFEVKSNNSNNYLGMLWEIIKPMILIAIYWFVFGFGIRGRGDVNGIDYLPWLLAGIVVWFFFRSALDKGSKAIYKRVKMISKMNFPMSAIPTFVILSRFYSHLMLLAIILIILQFFGFTVSIYLLQLPYYIFATVALLISVCLFTSTLTTVVRDIQLFISSVMRMLLYLSPILWTPETKEFPDFVATIMKLNPLYYIVEGYRHSLLGTSWYFAEHAQYTLYFWLVVLLFLVCGSVLHLKFRARFVEFI